MAARAPGTESTPSAAALALLLPDALASRDRVSLAPSGRDAGVMLILYDVDGRGHLVLTRRSDSVAHHRGEVALPGGRTEAQDRDLLDTALRETEEEIGVPREALAILGPLDDVHTIASGFTVSPWLAHHPGGRPRMTAEESEIARIMEVSLADVLAADRRLPRHADIATLRYPLMGEDVWGMTARILRNLADVVHRVAGPAAAP